MKKQLRGIIAVIMTLVALSLAPIAQARADSKGQLLRAPAGGWDQQTNNQRGDTDKGDMRRVRDSGIGGDTDKGDMRRVRDSLVRWFQFSLTFGW